MKLLKMFFLILAVTILSACSKSGDTEEKEHFASSQQRALEKAKGVDKIIMDADAKQRQQLENMER